MDRLGRFVREILGQPALSVDEARMLKAWVRDAGVTASERKQRKQAALEMKRSLLHKSGFPPYVDLRAFPRITSLPDGRLHFGGDLNLSGCTGLTSLPDGLRVGGDLSLRRCTGLTSMPHGLHVGGNLRLEGCAGLPSLAEDMHVDGDLHLEGCTGLTSLPDNVLEWGMRSNGRPHHIHLAGSGLPPEELARLQALDDPALCIHVSMVNPWRIFLRFAATRRSGLMKPSTSSPS